MNRRDNIYLVGFHQYALYYWCKSIELGVISNKSLLIHIDLHSDFQPPLIGNKPLVDSRSVLRAIQSKLIRHDSFIKPALDIGIIDDIFFCCNRYQINDYGRFTNYESPEVLFESMMSKGLSDREIVLDLDIDFFLEFQVNSDELVPMSTERITQSLQSISEIKKSAKVTTIATSPEIFGEHIEWKKRIFQTVIDVLGA